MVDGDEWAASSPPDARPFPFDDPLTVGAIKAASPCVLATLSPQLTPSRRRRIARAIHYRSGGVAVVLEHVHDTGNIAAVMRSAEAFGFARVHLVPAPPDHGTTDGRLGGISRRPAARVTQGADKWLEVEEWPDTPTCLAALRDAGYQIWATALGPQSLPLATAAAAAAAGAPLPLTALLLGEERAGVSRDAITAADLAVRLPMLGLSQSFNVSVAGALAMQELRRYRPQRYDRAQRRVATAAYYARSVPHAEALLRPLGDRGGAGSGPAL